MYCPFCQHTETKVVDSRLADDGSQVRRRRECLACEERYTTHESIEVAMPRVIKNDGRRCTFDEEKIRAGILRALEKRPVSIDKVDAAVAEVVHAVCKLGEREVESAAIGEVVMQQLQNIDQVAYVRFASVYRSFQDLHEFDQAIQKLKGNVADE